MLRKMIRLQGQGRQAVQLVVNIPVNLIHLAADLDPLLLMGAIKKFLIGQAAQAEN